VKDGSPGTPRWEHVAGPKLIGHAVGMRAAILRQGEMVVDDVADPRPALGQVLVRTLACGICGSDLHFVHHGRRLVELALESGQPAEIDLDRDVFMGHEFSAEVLEVGPDTIGPDPGTIVTSLPVMLTLEGIKQLAYSNDLPAGYGERMLLSAPLLLPVPNGLEPRLAALTEPMAVGLHAVVKSNIAAGESAVVFGCGPVGLAVIAALALRGIEVIVASDFSPARRALALTMGATVAVDPAEEPPIEVWRSQDGRRPLVIFEAVGVPGMLDAAMRAAPIGGRVLVVGVCMEADRVQPAIGVNKELNIQFAFAYAPDEFGSALRSLAEGEIDAAPMITGSVGLDGVPGAFEELSQPERHCKILVEP
jgi:threonine dehydrogenase-like Zn-dependent dehydrogenase